MQPMVFGDREIMKARTSTVKSIAPLTNVGLLTALAERVLGRADGLPGMATFHGFSGFGKSVAALYTANAYRAVLLECKSVWTKKFFCRQLCGELDIKPKATIAEMVEDIGAELTLSCRLLILDEADNLCSRPMIECVRDIYESGAAGIILIGEEGLPDKLRAWERVHGRMLDWVPAEPASLEDAWELARLYCPNIDVAEDLVVAAHKASNGSTRRLAVNLNQVAEKAAVEGWLAMSLRDWGGAWFTGTPPKGRLRTRAEPGLAGEVA